MLQAQGVAVQVGGRVLVEDVDFTVMPKDKVGLVGRNGAGKTSLFRVLGGQHSPHAGKVVVKGGFGYLPQDPRMEQGSEGRTGISHVLSGRGIDAELERIEKLRIAMEEHPDERNVGRYTRAEERFRDTGGYGAESEARAIAAGLGIPKERMDGPVGVLSGGERRRVELARILFAGSDVLCLDEPTNHLDIEGIQWLERLLATAPFASFIVSHDRYFLENVATHMMELNRRYPDGAFRVAGNYSAFLEKREAWFEAREKEREGLAARVRREVEWLRRGAKARTRKSKARLDEAARMIASLEDMEQRARTSTAAIDFTASDRKTRRLIELDTLAAEVAGRTLFRNLNLVLAPGRRLGLAGSNGCGKTTLLRILKGDLTPSEGTIKRADQLRIVYFDQMREQFPPEQTLRRALAPEGDSVIYQGRPVHVNSWAKRFLFREEQLPQPVGSLSGGERARIHIARLMLEEADVLLLDEPTNDLDLPTLEVLEEGLAEFPGAMVLVTHDRYLMDSVANGILGIDGQGGAELFADLAQWDAYLREKRAQKPPPERDPKPPATNSATPTSKKKLSYLEQREWDTMEERIMEAEARLEAAQQALHAPETISDPARIEVCYREELAAQQAVDTLYARWAELEEKQA